MFTDLPPVPEDPESFDLDLEEGEDFFEDDDGGDDVEGYHIESDPMKAQRFGL